MKDSIKNLTLASILTSLFIVITIFALSTGLGYGIYLDFFVPIFFVLVCLKCKMKYGILSGITSTLLVFMVLGDIAGALFISQSFLIGVICAYFMNKDSIFIEDIFFSSILATFLMLSIDIYTKLLTGYSFITEFQEMASWIPYKSHIDLFVYLLISFYIAGMCFCTYYLSLIIGKKLNILPKFALKKWFVFRNIKFFNSLLYLRRNTFLISAAYILILWFLDWFKISVPFTYLNFSLIIIKYIAYFYILRDCILIIKNYMLTKINKKIYVIIINFIMLILLVFIFKIQLAIMSVISYIIDSKNKIRSNQKKIVNLYCEKYI